MTIDTHPKEKSERNLKLAIIVTLVMLFLEVLGYVLSNSWALLSDAGHVLLHVLALGLTFWAIRIASKPPCDKSTYGHHRSEPLVALLNAMTMIILSLIIFYEAYRRFLEPPDIKGLEMFGIALIGLAGNVGVMFILRGPKDLTLRSAYLHVIGDALSSIVVVVGGLAIIYTGIFIIDPILSFFIAGIILFGSFTLAKESLEILLDRVPKHINMEKLRTKILEVEGVKALHDVHVWSLCSHLHAMSAHIIVDETHVGRSQEIIEKINSLLEKEFAICHCVIQVENKPCNDS